MSVSTNRNITLAYTSGLNSRVNPGLESKLDLNSRLSKNRKASQENQKSQTSKTSKTSQMSLESMSETHLHSLSDPNYVGPGSWFALHMLSSKAIPQFKDALVYYIKQFIDNFKCLRCREHAKKYMEVNPIENYLNQKDGLFKWTWEFHNTVNKRLGKPLVGWDEAYHMYHNPEAGVCSADCGGHGDEPEQPEEQPNMKEALNSDISKITYLNRPPEFTANRAQFYVPRTLQPPNSNIQRGLAALQVLGGSSNSGIIKILERKPFKMAPV